MSERSEHVRSQSLIGMDAERMPYLSPFGWIYRLSRLNGVRVHQLCHVFNLPATASKLLHGGEPVGWTALNRCLRASGTGYDSDFDAKAWLPYLALCHDSDSSPLRGCRTCLAFGYHTYLHQLPWVKLCPWHGEPLHCRCPCGRPLLPRQDSSPNQRLLACSCGHDHFDRSKALLGMSLWPEGQVRRAIEVHLRASERAGRRHVLHHAHGRLARPSVLNMALIDLFEVSGRGSLREVRVFGETERARAVSTKMASAIINRWTHAVDHNKSQRFESSLPLLPEDYERVTRFVTTLSTDRTPPLLESIPDVCREAITLQGDILLSAPSGERIHALLEAPLINDALLEVGASLIHSVRDRLAFHRPLPVALEHTVHGEILALALSDITARVAIDGIQQLAKVSAAGNRRYFRRSTGAPVALLTYRPTTRIRVGFRTEQDERLNPIELTPDPILCGR